MESKVETPTPTVSRSRRKTFTVQEPPHRLPTVDMCNRTFISDGGGRVPPPLMFPQNGIVRPPTFPQNVESNFNVSTAHHAPSNIPPHTYSSSAKVTLSQQHPDGQDIKRLLNKLKGIKCESQSKNRRIQELTQTYTNKLIEVCGVLRNNEDKCDTTGESEDEIFEQTTVESAPPPPPKRKSNADLEMHRLEHRVLSEKLEKVNSCSNFLNASRREELAEVVKKEEKAVSKLEGTKRRLQDVNEEIVKLRNDTTRRSRIRENRFVKFDMAKTLAVGLLKASDNLQCTEKAFCDAFIKDPTKTCCELPPAEIGPPK